MTDLRERIEITFDDFQDWIERNSPPDWLPEDTIDLLSFMGYVYFQTMREELPNITLSQCSQIFFENSNKDDLWKKIREENNKPLLS